VWVRESYFCPSWGERYKRCRMLPRIHYVVLSCRGQGGQQPCMMMSTRSVRQQCARLRSSHMAPCHHAHVRQRRRCTRTRSTSPWQEFSDPASGRRYYWYPVLLSRTTSSLLRCVAETNRNSQTNETVWDQPPVAPLPPPPPAPPAMLQQIEEPPLMAPNGLAPEVINARLASTLIVLDQSTNN
jgi:hypothetical protein